MSRLLIFTLYSLHRRIVKMIAVKCINFYEGKIKQCQRQVSNDSETMKNKSERRPSTLRLLSYLKWPRFNYSDG